MRSLTGYCANMQVCLERNSVALSKPLSELPTILDAFFRFNAHGELINTQHLKNLVAIVRHNPHCTFALWSKRSDIVRKFFDRNAKPSNMILVFSNAKIGKVLKNPPKHFDKTFNNVMADDRPELQNCTGQQCKSCLICYRHNTTQTIVEKVK